MLKVLTKGHSKNLMAYFLEGEHVRVRFVPLNRFKPSSKIFY